MIRFYESLKNDIKDDLYRKDISDILVEYIQRTIRIDDRLYIYRIKKYS